jgi:D-alanyl-lipoteichoic acid acyltransferase DltB (MBOAT superfamily)
MAYNTNTYFILFLPIAMLLYQILPKRYRWVGLLLSSMAFFVLISDVLIYWAIITTAITYVGGVALERIQSPDKKVKKRKQKHVVQLCVIAVVGILAVLKYTAFTLDLVNQLMAKFGNDTSFQVGKILVPIGISFYTLQAVGYLLDVYWKRLEAEKNPAKLLLFMIFFPTLMEGPICRYSDTKDQLFEGEAISCDSIVAGAIRIGYGLFKRMVISDRLYWFVNNFYRPSSNYTGAMIIICAVATTVQLYLEFSGTIDIVIGSARIFNIRLPENFRQPFLAKSAAEFWRRWHISLGTWFKNYIFYPVTTSKLMKRWNKYGRKHMCKYITMVVTSAIALFPVWMLNGLWHGPKIPYILYGVYYFVILLAEVMIEPAGLRFWKLIHLNPEGRIVSCFRIARTWIIIFAGEMLFRAETLEQFITMCKNIFVGDFLTHDMYIEVFNMGISKSDALLIAIACLIVIAMDLRLEYYPDTLEMIPQLSRPKRWAIYYFMIFAILIFGAYGIGYDPAELIYAGF